MNIVKDLISSSHFGLQLKDQQKRSALQQQQSEHIWILANNKVVYMCACVLLINIYYF